MQDSPSMESAIFSPKLNRRFGLSADSWNSVFIWTAAFAAFLTVIAVVSQCFVIQLQRADAKATSAAFEQYKVATGKEIAEATSRGEEAKARAAEAELKLIEYRKSRAPVIKEHSAEFVAVIEQFKGTRFDMGHAPVGREQWDFAWNLEPLMAQAGWVFAEWMSDEKHCFPKLNWTMLPHQYGIANVSNVSVETDDHSGAEIVMAAAALVVAFKTIGIEAIATRSDNGSPNRGIVHLLIGEKQ
jgi:hypothetical protein